ncbi:hypothetical protein [Streptococcus sobrinus]|uniref:hypothetical protein n=1 Tax=Streptococcus sobrinus TaxID=1310 RepID=UPI0002D90DFB|nr:hypothetical protein [Streptococcus sobrinus]
MSEEFESEQTYSRRSASRSQSHAKPKKKKSKGKRIFWSLLLLVLVLGGAGAAYRYWSGDINGSYRATTLEEESVKQLKESSSESSDSSHIDASQYITFRVDVTVKDDKATAKETITFDRKKAYEQYRNMLEAQIKDKPGVTLEDLEQYGTPTTEEAFLQKFNEDTKKLAKQSSLTYDEEAGTAKATIFEGKVNRWTHGIDITKVYGNGGLTVADSKATSNPLDIFKKGNSLPFDKTDSGLSLKADKTIQLRKN